MPDNPPESIRAELANRHVQRGDWPDLLDHGNAWVVADPLSAPGWQAVSRAGFELGFYRASLDAWRRVVALAGRTPTNLVTLGRIALHAQELDLAREVLDEAGRAGAGDMPERLAAQGLLFLYLGRLAEAEACCRRALAVNPEFVPAYTTLGRLIKGRFSDRELGVLSQLTAHEKVPVDFRIPAAFALGHGLEARDDVTGAFRAFQYAHSLALARNQREGRVYDHRQSERRFARLARGFDPHDAGRPADAAVGPVPIFIVGMPRSGTTLVESLLSAHSRVQACGERVQMQQLLQEALAGSTGAMTGEGGAGMLENWRRAYLAEIDPGTDHFTDKHPLNFEAAGLIVRLFPNSPIVHVRRNPLETCWSIYRNEFSRYWAFTDRLADLGHYYGQYARLSAHWERVLGSRFHTVQYEGFAADFDAAAPGLVESCGLEWEERCRQFQSVGRAIATFSAVSAREPVRVRSGAAEKFRPYLGDLVEALEAAGVDSGTGALRAGV